MTSTIDGSKVYPSAPHCNVVGSSFDDPLIQFCVVCCHLSWHYMAGVQFQRRTKCTTCFYMRGASTKPSSLTITWCLQVVIWLLCHKILSVSQPCWLTWILRDSSDTEVCGNANAVTCVQLSRCKDVRNALLGTAVFNARGMIGHCTKRFAEHWQHCVGPNMRRRGGRHVT
jgi:hypothetical protein